MIFYKYLSLVIDNNYNSIYVTADIGYFIFFSIKKLNESKKNKYVKTFPSLDKNTYKKLQS